MTIENYGDVKLLLDENGTIQNTDISLFENRELLQDFGLENAILISLFTDARADDNESTSDKSSNRRGWWCDDIDKDNTGSKLWVVLSRAKLSDPIIPAVNKAVKDSLAWLIEDNVAKQINVDCQIVSDLLAIKIEILSFNLKSKSYKYYYNWKNQTSQ